jgi:hypothetical protein
MQGVMRNACMILVWEPEGESVLRRPSHKWKVNIQMCLK